MKFRCSPAMFFSQKLTSHLVAAIVSLLVITSLQAHAEPLPQSPTEISQKWSAWWEFGGYYTSDDASRGEVTLFSPLLQGPDDLVFLDARGKLFEQDVSEGNFALGYRHMLDQGWNIGAWIGYDLRQSEQNNTFRQLSGGIEILHPDWDFRLNGYYPLTNPQMTSSNATLQITGNQLLFINSEEVPLEGADVEIGARLPLERWISELTPDLFELRAYGGYFHFDDDEAIKEIAGPKGRVEIRFNDVFADNLPGARLTAEFEYSYDDVRGSRYEAGARLRVPFGGRRNSDSLPQRRVALTRQESLMMEGLERDTDIIVVSAKPEPVTSVAMDMNIDQIYQTDDGESLLSAVSKGANNLILVSGEKGAIDLTNTNGILLQQYQILLGGGATALFRGRRTGTIASLTAPGSQPTLTAVQNTGDNGVVTVASNTQVTGFNFEKGGPFGGTPALYGDHVNNVLISENSITGGQSTGIRIDNGSNINIQDNIISDQVFGIYVPNSQNINIADNVIQNGFNGITTNDSTDITITRNFIDSLLNGIVGRGERIIISDNVVQNTGTGIRLEASNSVVSRNSIENIELYGIFSQDSSNSRIDHNQIFSVPVRISAFDSQNLQIANNVIHANDTGVTLDSVSDLNSNIVLEDNFIASSGGYAFETFVDIPGLRLSGNNFSSNGNGWVSISNNTNGVVVENNIFAGFEPSPLLVLTNDDGVTGDGNIDNTIANSGVCTTSGSVNIDVTFTDGSSCF